LVLVAHLEQLVLVLPVMEHRAETQSFIPQHIPHIPQLNLFVEQVVDLDQVGQEEMVLLLLADQVEVEVEKILVHPPIILLEQQ
jgi:hypothetical protein